MSAGRWAGIVVVSAALALSVAALSRLPWDSPGSDAALLRISWRMRVPAGETCRERTAEELERLPIHMRTPEVCTAESASYTLITAVGEHPPDTIPLARGGAKGDRPLFVLDQRALPPGTHRVAVRLLRAVRGGGDSVLVAFDSVLPFERGAVRLVTLEDGRGLVTR